MNRDPSGTSGPDATYKEDAYFASRLTPDSSRERLWRVLCGYLQRDVAANGSVLELGGGYCYFINNIQAAEKHVVDVYEGIVQAAAAGVTAHVQSCVNLSNFGSDSCDTIFASNLFEHLTRPELLNTLAEIQRVLRRKGRLLIIQPNFKYSYRDYFDDYTHVQIFTDASLTDLLAASGFTIERVVPRFLPFSVKSRGPKWTWLLRLYLTLPWRPFAGQMYIVAGKAA